MTLQGLEDKWSEYLAADGCPPVLGLAPLSEEESEIIHGLVGAQLGQPSRSRRYLLYTLLEEFPSCLAVWLARKAGEAYEAGAFWDKFGELVGMQIPVYQRDELAQRFRCACRSTMAAWIPPEDLGGHNIVAEFLYQAGLPLDRCDRFAQHVRKVERSFGLPDMDASDAGEQLRDTVLESLQTIPVPTLKRALRGPAGPRICEVALSVVMKGDFAGINPRLGQELERVFEHAERGTLRRSMHQPFIRLGDDLGSLEVVGPRQDASLVASGGLTWVIDGRRVPTPRNEEFVDKVTDRARVAVELVGLAVGLVPPRNFVLRLEDRTEPFILFDDRTRKERRASGPLPAASYWLLHRANDTLVGGEQRYEWPDGDRALSFFRVRPGCEVSLHDGPSGTWRFVAAFSPFFEAQDDSLSCESGESLCFGWSELPAIWMLAEQADTELLAQWRVGIRGTEVDHKWSLSRTADEVGGMVKCRVESADFLESLEPAVYRLQFSLQRAERGRAEAYAEYWLWKGLQSFDGAGFRLIASPANLVNSECRGFSCQENAILHRTDRHRKHTLAFNVSGTPVVFDWSQPGVFVESLERRAGERSMPRPHRLGEAFSASLDSARWLRLWLTGESDWEIVIAGQSWQRAVAGDRREFLEFSLASLAMAFPQGGEILLRLGRRELLVARFSSPLQPVTVERVEDKARVGLTFHFPERIDWTRVIAWDLATGQRRSLDGQQFGAAGRCVFFTEDLPQIECTNLPEPNASGAGLGHRVTLDVPKLGWPQGFWVIDLDVRRDEAAEWEPVVIHGGEHAPVVVRAGRTATTTRASLLWASVTFGTQVEDHSLDDPGSEELFALLVDLIALRKWEFASVVRQDFGWLKDAVRSLSQLAGRMARHANGDPLQTRLLNLACQDPNHDGFVYLPGLLALPAGEYCELPVGDPLNDALRRCGRLALADSVAEVVRHDFTFFDINVVGCFANFATVASGVDGTSGAEFERFSHENYWQELIGTLEVNRLASDWFGEGTLGRAHTVWAFAELVKRYEHSTHELNLAAANALLHCAPDLRTWLSSRLRANRVMSASAWTAPWLRLAAPDTDFLEAAPRFASLFALAARASAAGLLEFDETLAWLETQVGRRYMAEEGIAVLVSLAPELFGHQLLFWELILRTMPH